MATSSTAPSGKTTSTSGTSTSGKITSPVTKRSAALGMKRSTATKKSAATKRSAASTTTGVQSDASLPKHTTAPPANNAQHRAPDSEPLPQVAPLDGQTDFADLTAEVAAEINGSGRNSRKWGSGRELDERLKAAGHDPKKVRAAIAKLRKSNKA